MNCTFVQGRLLSLEDPSWVPEELRCHLEFCDHCRDWHDQLLLLEQHVSQVPVPRSRAKSRFLRQFLQESSKEVAPQSVPAERSSARPRLLPLPLPAVPAVGPRLSRAAGLAAAVVLIVLGWWIFSQRTSVSEPAPSAVKAGADPLLASLVQRDIRLATAHTPRERLEILADMAQELQDTTRTLAQAVSGEQLQGLASLYDQLVREGIVKQAQALPAGERPMLRPLADRFARTAHTFEQLGQKLPATLSGPLQTVVAAAREGNRHLFGLLAEAGS
jgi:hypothetical protein